MPNLVVSVDIHGAKCLILILTAYLATTAAEVKPNTAAIIGSPGAPHTNTAHTTSTAASGNTSNSSSTGVNSKSVMQRVLMADPTLRTLFWLEEQENKKKKAGACVDVYFELL